MFVCLFVLLLLASDFYLFFSIHTAPPRLSRLCLHARAFLSFNPQLPPPLCVCPLTCSCPHLLSPSLALLVSTTASLTTTCLAALAPPPPSRRLSPLRQTDSSSRSSHSARHSLVRRGDDKGGGERCCGTDSDVPQAIAFIASKRTHHPMSMRWWLQVSTRSRCLQTTRARPSSQTSTSKSQCPRSARKRNDDAAMWR